MAARIFLLAIGFWLAAAARGDVIISNLNAADGGSTGSGVKDAGFRTPAGAYFRLDQFTVRVEILPGGVGNPSWSLWSGTTAPSTLITTLSPPAGPAATGWLTLTPDSDVILLPSTVYWLRCDLVGGVSVVWDGSNFVNPSGLATHVNYLFNGVPSAQTNSYRVEGRLIAALINFDTLPGTDHVIGTSDDSAISAPALFFQQPTQTTRQFESQGVVFLPNPPLQDVNEILNNDTFADLAFSSEPNLLASSFSAGGVIRGQFLRPVYGVGASLGLVGQRARLEILDASGAVMQSTTRPTTNVFLQSSTPISSFRVVNADSPGGTVAIDNLILLYERPETCVADLTGSSDPGDLTYGVPDGVVDAADFFYYLDRFSEPCP